MPSWQSRLVSLIVRMTLKRAGRRQAWDIDETVRRVRLKIEPNWLQLRRVPSNVRRIPIEASPVRGEWLIGSETDNRIIYYLHGGGYVAGSPASHRNLTSRLALAAKARVFALDYRLAPEHPFPAPVEDALAGYRWLLDQGITAERIAIGGDSAGGGLTLATLQRIRDTGLPLPSAAFLLSPWTDLACTGESLELNDQSDNMLCSSEVHRFSRVYFGEESAYNPLVSPVYANFTALPPMLVYASDTEVLLDDSRRVAERAGYYGVEVDLRIWNDQLHAWPILAGLSIPESLRAIREIGDFVRQRVPAEGRPVAFATAS